MFDDDFSCVRVSQRVFGGALEHLPNKDGDTISLPALVYHAKWLIEVWWIIMEDCFFVRYSDAPPPPAWFCGQFRRSFFFRDFRLSSNTFLLSLLLQQWIFASVFFSFSSLDVNGFIGRLSQGVIREKLFIHVKLSRNSIKHSFDIWFKGDAGWLKLSHIYLYLFKTQSDFTGFSTKFTLQYGKKTFPPPPSSCGTDRTIVRQAMSMGGVTFKVSVYLPTAAGAGAIIFLRHQYCWVSVVKGKENDHRPPMLCLLSHHFFFAFLLSRDGGYCCCWWKWTFFPYRELEIFTSSTIGLLNRYCRVVYSVRLGP